MDDPYAGCNRDLVLVGVDCAPGIGSEAADAALYGAMRKINEQVLANVKSDLVVASQEFASSADGVRWQQEMRARITIESEGPLPGAVPSDRWVDTATNQTCVQVTVERAELVRLLLVPVEESQLKAQGLLDGLQQARSEPAHALLITLKAYDLLARTVTDALRANAAAGSGTSGTTRTPAARHAQPAYEKSKHMLAMLLDQVAATAPLIKVFPVSGDAQRGDPWDPLVEPLVGRVTMDLDGEAMNMAELPMRFRAEVPGASREPTLVPGGATTDPEGVIRCAVADLAAGPDGQGRVLLELDVDRLGPSRLADILPQATFVYNVRTRGQTAVAVAIEARYQDTLLENVDLTSLVAGHLTAKGFRATGRPDATRLGIEALQGTLSDEFQYVVRCEVTSSYTGREGDTYFFEASAKLEIVHLATGRIVQPRLATRQKQRKQHDEQGARLAIDLLKKELLTSLDRDFVADFGP